MFIFFKSSFITIRLCWHVLQRSMLLHFPPCNLSNKSYHQYLKLLETIVDYFPSEDYGLCTASLLRSFNCLMQVRNSSKGFLLQPATYTVDNEFLQYHIFAKYLVWNTIKFKITTVFHKFYQTSQQGCARPRLTILLCTVSCWLHFP